jgi:hypothetical protein
MLTEFSKSRLGKPKKKKKKEREKIGQEVYGV